MQITEVQTVMLIQHKSAVKVMLLLCPNTVPFQQPRGDRGTKIVFFSKKIESDSSKAEIALPFYVTEIFLLSTTLI